MNQAVTLAGLMRAMAALQHAFEFGMSVERPGVTDAAHTTTWHMAGLVEQLRRVRTDGVEELRRRGIARGPDRVTGPPLPSAGMSTDGHCSRED